MFDTFKKIFFLSQKRIEDLENDDKGWYNGYETFLKGMREEIGEMEQELKENNSVHLEDELGDILWDYLSFINVLEKRNYISSAEKVFERIHKKYGERLKAVYGQNTENAWYEIKKKQKEELQQEHQEKHGEK
ncbi:nucleotide pyrophosphohydrolase [Candidatus Gracilibacteria bacterium]|nr:nucleotide pyrophosphohydrolase [Candidatus Gracilibacteria bacterium]NUJ99364.1 nucleotide pyrophosphohydrolase [Candidatus Gracilibacteria bacterium]